MQIRLNKLVLEKLSLENFLNIVKILHNIKERKLPYQYFQYWSRSLLWIEFVI